MTPLGKSLIFYLKYPAEMNRLCAQADDDENPDLTAGLEDAERVLKMARAVGAEASREAADFLKVCAAQIENHFTGLGIVTLASPKSRRFLERKWEWSVNVLVNSVRYGSFWCGVSIYYQSRIIVPWLWRTGGRDWEEAVLERLGNRAHSRAGGGVVSDPGTVALASIPIFFGDEQDGVVDRDALVAKVVSAFSLIRAEDVLALARNASEGDDSPEIEEAKAGFPS